MNRHYLPAQIVSQNHVSWRQTFTFSAKHLLRRLPIFLLILVSACSSRPEFSSAKPNIAYNESNHQAYLQQLNNWQVTGKIALLSHSSKESASLFWQNQPFKQQEKLALTTYLGISILSIEKTDDLYHIAFDNQHHQHSDLEYLLWTVLGYQLPTNALKYWLKGIPYSKNDKVELGANQLTPKSIISRYKGATWTINYQSYQRVEGVMLPNKITIKQNDLTIKLAINQWTL